MDYPFQRNCSLSVIVPIYNVKDFLPACLDSVASQSTTDYEVIMVDDGSTDISSSIAKQYDEKYPHFHYFRKENSGLGAARNYGIARSKGEYITFLDSDDIIPPNAYEMMLARAKENDADIVTGNVTRFNSEKEWASSLHKKVFVDSRERTTLEETPVLLFDTIACNKLIKRSFWDDCGLSFPQGVLYEDIPVVIPMYCQARSVSMIEETIYLWRAREGAAKSITQSRTDFKNLHDRINALRSVDDFFSEHTMSQSVKRVKDHKWLDLDLPIYINVCDKASDEFFDYLADYVVTALSSSEESVFDELSVVKKMKYEALRKRDKALLINVLTYEKMDYRYAKFKKRNIEGKDRYFLRPPKRLSGIFPENTFDITDNLEKYPPVSMINNIAWNEDTLHIDGYCFLPKIPCPRTNSQKVQAFLVDCKTKERIPLAVEQIGAVGPRGRNGVILGTNSAGKRQLSLFNYKGSGFSIDIDFTLSCFANLEKQSKFCIEMTIEKGTLSNTFLLSGRSKKTKVDGLLGVSPLTIRPYFGAGKTLFIECIRHAAFASDIFSENNLFYLKMHDDVATTDLAGINAPLNSTNEGSILIDPNTLGNPLPEEIVLEVGGETVAKIGRPKTVFVNSGKNTWSLSSSSRGSLVLQKNKLNPYVKSIQSKQSSIDIAIVLDVKADPNLKSEFELLLKSPESDEPIAFRGVQKDDCVVFSINKDSPQLRYLFSGTWEASIHPLHNTGTEASLPVYIDSHLPQEPIEDETHRYSFCANSAEFLCLKSRRKWKKIESTSPRRKVIADFVYPILRLLPLNEKKIVFEGLWGRKYYCNPKALYEYIDEHHPEYECVWSLRDEKIHTNGSGRPVRRMSLSYHYHMATAKYFVNNVNFHGSFKKRKGQIEIQTMHGMPLKTIGLDAPGEFDSDDAKQSFLNKCHRWDYVVVQNEIVKNIVRSCYDFKGSFLETGYPRNDMLFKTDEETIRDIKHRLGLPQDKKVILYAPTWRIEGMFDFHFELESLKKALSDDYVMLLRVHPLATKGMDKSIIDNEFIFDATPHPSTEELFLISDVAMTDYSSLMFDYAILEKPLLFYVYDLESYRDTLRGFYFDFESIAPGPMLKSQEDVIEILRDYQKLKEDYREDILEFRRKFCTFDTGNASRAIVDIALKGTMR